MRIKIAAKMFKHTFIGSISALVFVSAAAANDRTQVAGYETYAVVEPVTDEAAAQPFAQRHCAKYGKFANFRWMEGCKAVFDCGVRREVIRPSQQGGVY